MVTILIHQINYKYEFEMKCVVRDFEFDILKNHNNIQIRVDIFPSMSKVVTA